MSLMVWLPLNGNLNNYGLSNLELTTTVNPTYVNNGKIGQALSTGSVTMSASNSALILNNQEFSFACWIYVNADAGDTTKKAMIFGTNGMTAPNNRKFSIFQYPTCNDLHLSWQNDVTNTTFTGGVWSGYFPSYKWTHIAITYKNPNGTIYINGQKKSTFSGISNSQSFSFDTRLFENCANNGRYLNDYRIYNHALSPLEVKHLAQGLVLHYPLDRQGFGQDNLYTGSKNFSGSWVNLSSWTTDSESYSGFTVKKKSSVWGGLAQNITCTNGDIFTISFYAKVDSGGNILSIHRSSLGNVTTGLTILDGNFKSGIDWVTINDDGTKWKYYWATVKITSSDITYLQWRIENSVTNKYLYICGMKLERGSIATLWTPAPSDDLYSQMGLNSNIEEDVSGYGNNGTQIGTITYSGDTPRYQVSMSFNGSDSGILIDNLYLSNIINTAVTYSFWIKPSGENGARSIYFGSYSNNSWSIEKTSSNLIRGYWNGNPDISYSGATIVDNIWQHVCITKNGTSDVKVYINGELKASSTATHNNLSFPTTYRIGRDVRSGDGTPYKGLMSDFRIYTTALSEEDVLELYHTPISLTSSGTLMTQGEYVEV